MRTIRQIPQRFTRHLYFGHQSYNVILTTNLRTKNKLCGKHEKQAGPNNLSHRYPEDIHLLTTTGRKTMYNGKAASYAPTPNVPQINV